MRIEDLQPTSPEKARRGARILAAPLKVRNAIVRSREDIERLAQEEEGLELDETDLLLADRRDLLEEIWTVVADQNRTDEDIDRAGDLAQLLYGLEPDDADDFVMGNINASEFICGTEPTAQCLGAVIAEDDVGALTIRGKSLAGELIESSGALVNARKKASEDSLLWNVIRDNNRSKQDVNRAIPIAMARYGLSENSARDLITGNMVVGAICEIDSGDSVTDSIEMTCNDSNAYDTLEFKTVMADERIALTFEDDYFRLRNELRAITEKIQEINSLSYDDEEIGDMMDQIDRGPVRKKVVINYPQVPLVSSRILTQSVIPRVDIVEMSDDEDYLPIPRGEEYPLPGNMPSEEYRDPYTLEAQIREEEIARDIIRSRQTQESIQAAREQEEREKQEVLQWIRENRPELIQ